MLVAQPLLFQVDQLAQRHLQDRVGLDGGQRVGRRPRRVPAGTAAKPVSPSARAIMAAGHWMPIRPILASAWVAEWRMIADDLVDVGQGQQQAFDGVLAAAGLGQQELRAAADHRSRGGGGTPAAVP